MDSPLKIISNIKRLPSRHIWFISLFLLSLAIFYKPLNALVHLSLQNDKYSYIALIPFLAAYFTYSARHRIVGSRADRRAAGSPLCVLGLLIFLLADYGISQLGAIESLGLAIFGVVVSWLGLVAICYGIGALTVTLPSVLVIFLMIPPPPAALETLIFYLQSGSAEAAHLLFRLSGIEVYRQGFTFSLPGVDIEIAEQCSGIRSSTALFLTVLIAGQLFLQSSITRIVLYLFIVPIAIFKNALRIVTISWLAINVDREYLFGSLHHSYGGMVFSAVALLALWALIALLRRSERYLRKSHPVHQVVLSAAREA